MKTLEDIKQERAYEMDYSDWEEFIYSVDDPDIVDVEFDEVAIRFAREVAREALKNASDNSQTTTIRKGDGVIDYYITIVDKSSILSDKNIPEI